MKTILNYLWITGMQGMGFLFRISRWISNFWSKCWWVYADECLEILTLLKLQMINLLDWLYRCIIKKGQYLILTKKVSSSAYSLLQEVLSANFDESYIVRKILSWEVKNLLEIPGTNNPFSRYWIMKVTKSLLFIYLCCHLIER